jgi:hypothetical protein
MTEDLPTPRSTLRASRVHIRCKAYRHRNFADLQKLVDSGRCDVPLIRLRFFRCSSCPVVHRLAGEQRLQRAVVTTRRSAAVSGSREPGKQSGPFCRKILQSVTLRRPRGSRK